MHTKFKLRSLSVKWSISKAQDTYGYNRLTLTDNHTGSRHVQCGGGYCMTSAALADWANAHLQDRLDTITPEQAAKLYGLWHKSEVWSSGRIQEHARIDGGIGVSSVQRILEAVGIEAEETYDRSKRNPKLIGFMVGEKD
jgi:hypothetical protein